MNYPITTESLEIMFRMTRITGDNMRKAIHDHLVLGIPKAEAAGNYGIHRQQIQPHIKRLMEEIKPAFDAYAEWAKTHFYS